MGVYVDPGARLVELGMSDALELEALVRLSEGDIVVAGPLEMAFDLYDALVMFISLRDSSVVGVAVSLTLRSSLR
jgi:hypothetical protein